MNLRQLEALRAVVQTGTTISAARELNVSQPAVSRLINEFERSLGTPLFIRESGRLIPTDVALNLVRDIDHALTGLRSAIRTAGISGRAATTRLNIVATAGLMRNFIADCVSTVMVKYPNSVFNIEHRTTDQMVDALITEQADLGICQLPITHPGIDVVPMAEVSAVCLVREDHPLAAQSVLDPAALAEVPLILVSKRFPFRQHVDDAFTRARIIPNIRFESGSAQLICSAAARGIGVAVINSLMAHDCAVPNLRMVRFTPDITTVFAVLIRRSANLSPLADTLIKALRREIDAVAATLPRA